MHIVITATSNFKPTQGGVAELTHQLAFHLALKGHVVTVFAWESSNSDRKYDDSMPYSVIRVNNTTFRKLFFQTCRKEKIDLLLVNVMGSSWGLSWIAAKLFGIPIAVWTHGMEVYFPDAGVFHKDRIKTRFALKHSNFILCSSTYTAKKAAFLRKKSEGVYTVNPGISLKELPEVLPEQDKVRTFREFDFSGKRIILCLGRVIKRKGIDIVIEALPHIQKEFPESVIVIAGMIGQQERTRLTHISEKCSVKDSVFIMGEIDEQEKQNLYQIQDVYAMPSRELPGGDVEGFGITFLEANLYAKPVIGTLSGGIPDAIKNMHSGLLVEPSSPNAVAEAVVFLFSNPEQLKMMGQYGRKRVIEQFGWIHVTEKVLEIFSYYFSKGDSNIS